jgi:hypothetical protein
MRVAAEFAWEAGREREVREVFVHAFLRERWLAEVGACGARIIFDATVTFSEAAALCETFAGWREPREAGVRWRAAYVLDAARFLREGWEVQ